MTNKMPTISSGALFSRKNITEAINVNTNSIWPTARTKAAFSRVNAVNQAIEPNTPATPTAPA